MSTPELGGWDPLALVDTVEVFRAARFRWWISGGRSLELHLDRSWRDHADTDVGVARKDVHALRSVLEGWDVHVAAAGRLEPWTGQRLDPELHQNNLWCRRTEADPWSLDVTIGEGDDDQWIYRRNRRVSAPWEEAVLETPDGVPYLAPELQLLFKSKGVRAKDDIDAREVIPQLSAERRARLASLLPEDHRWQHLLAAHP